MPLLTKVLAKVKLVNPFPNNTNFHNIFNFNNKN